MEPGTQRELIRYMREIAHEMKAIRKALEADYELIVEKEEERNGNKSQNNDV